MSTVTIDGRPATRDEWLAARRSSIGASEAAVILGLTPSLVRLWLAKTGREVEDRQTPEMRRGLKLEPYIAGEWDAETGDPIVATQVFHRHPTKPHLSCTIDGVTESGRLVEFKRVGPHGLIRRIDGPDDIEALPDPFIAQAAHQMLVTGAAEIWFAIKLPDDSVNCVGPVRRPEKLIALIESRADAFWAESVLADVPPDEVHHEDARALARAFRGQTGEILRLGEPEMEDAIRLHELNAEIRGREKERDERKARLLLALGDAAGADLPGGWGLKRSVIEVNHRATEARQSTQVRLTVQQPKD